MKIKDCFSVFSLPISADEVQLKKKYRELVKLYHPDSNQESSNREKFELIQYSYETILAYFEYAKTHTDEIINAEESKLERIRRSQKIQRDRLEKELQLIYDSVNRYTSSFRYKISSAFAILSFLLALTVFLDASIPTNIEFEPIQGVKISSDSYNVVHLFAKDDVYDVSIFDYYNLLGEEFVLIESTTIFNQVKNISISNDNMHLALNYKASSYIVGLALSIFLLLGLFIFIVKDKYTAMYYFMLRYYNGWILPIVFLIVLFSGGRVFYLFGLF